MLFATVKFRLLESIIIMKRNFIPVDSLQQGNRGDPASHHIHVFQGSGDAELELRLIEAEMQSRSPEVVKAVFHRTDMMILTLYSGS